MTCYSIGMSIKSLVLLMDSLLSNSIPKKDTYTVKMKIDPSFTGKIDPQKEYTLMVRLTTTGELIVVGAKEVTTQK